MNAHLRRLIALCWSTPFLNALAAEAPKPQYHHADIDIPTFRADEPKRAQLSVPLAEKYLQQGALAWQGSKNCISCHTTGLYLTTRPQLTPFLGKPLAGMRNFFVSQLRTLQAMPRTELQKSTRPAQVIYLAAGLAEWDANLTKQLSSETAAALALMFSLQQTNGTWGSLDCWPPYESDAFHLATVAATAVATAPNWLANLKDSPTGAAVDRLKSYLRDTPPPHDYARVLLLWASTRLPGLLDGSQQKALIEMIWKHQRPDGGWSLRTFAAPEAWGRGNRAEKLRAEPEFNDPPSDGHQTGLAIVVLRDAAVPASDVRLQRGVKWLQSNQRESGRWWTRSLNTDNFHYITYSGTAFPLLALAKCGALPLVGN